jgi:glycerol-3-phosphate dehydrogenase
MIGNLRTEAEVVVVGAGVVGSASALALARHGVSTVLLEREPAPGLAASGTNSGIVHTGFDSPPGELETELILRSAELRDPVLETLGLPVLRCGALLHPRDEAERAAVEELAANAKANGVEVALGDDGSLRVPGEAITDPIAYTQALAAAAERHGADLLTSARLAAVAADGSGLSLSCEEGGEIRCRLLVNCGGLYADEVARLCGDSSFEVYPRKGEFLVFDLAPGAVEEILLPVPSKRTKGVLVFPTIDGKVVAGPTAVDQEDKEDWSVRPEAGEEILPKAAALLPALEGAEPVAAYAGLRPAGRGANYVIGPSRACDRLLNVAAIRSTGLTASLGIAERVVQTAGRMGIRLGDEAPLRGADPPKSPAAWWRRVAEHRRAA